MGLVSLFRVRKLKPRLVLSSVAWTICKSVSSLMKVRNVSHWRSLNTTLFHACNSAKSREADVLCVHAPLHCFMEEEYLIKDVSSKI